MVAGRKWHAIPSCIPISNRNRNPKSYSNPNLFKNHQPYAQRVVLPAELA